MGRTGGIASGFVQTTLALQRMQQQHAREKEEVELRRKELKLREDVFGLQAKKAQEALASNSELQKLLLGGGDTSPAPTTTPSSLQDALSGTQFETVPQPPTTTPGGTLPISPRADEAFPGVPRPPLTAEAPKLSVGQRTAPTVAAPSDPFGQIPPQVRALAAQALAAGHEGFANKLLEPYLKEGGSFTLGEGQTRYGPRGEVIATGPEKSGKGASPELIDAIVAQPQLFERLPAETRAAITPELVKRGVKASDMMDPQDKVLQQLRIAKAHAEIGAAQRTASGALTEGDKRKLALSVRTDIRQEPAFKDLTAARSGHTSLMVGARQANAQGDLAILNGVVRLLDPGSVVRPSEFETARKAQGLIDQIDTLLPRIQKGEILSPKVRGQFVDLANNLMKEWEGTAKKEIGQVYGSVLKGTGIGIDDVFVAPETLRAQGPGGGKIADPLGVR